MADAIVTRDGVTMMMTGVVLRLMQRGMSMAGMGMLTCGSRRDAGDQQRESRANSQSER
ncbi:MAG: hypothetical protein ABSG76_19135 [Xanthobacteraceae bacterium]